jgi:hypothetical protein
MSGKPIEIGDEVVFKIDLRGFIANYKVVDIKQNSAKIDALHFLKDRDPYHGTWREISELKTRWT